MASSRNEDCTDTVSATPSWDDLTRLWICRQSIEDQLRPRDILDYLRQGDALTEDESERIMSKETTTERAKTLLDMILRKDNLACGVFLGALRETYKHLYQLVQDTTVTETNRRRFLAFLASTDMATHSVTASLSFSPSGDVPTIPDDPAASYDVPDTVFIGRTNKKHNMEKDVMHILKSELCDYYQHVLKNIRPIAWNDEVLLNMADFYNDLVIVDATQTPSVGLPGFEIQRDDKSVTTVTDVKMLFGSSSGQCRRILLEGEPGIGKSTFCSKLALDWANNVSGQNKPWMERFEYVICFPADLVEDSLVASLTNHILADDVVGLSTQQLELKFMDPEVQEKTLLIFDAYDEAKNKQLIHDIWNGKVLRKCTTLITCRVGQSTPLAKAMDKRCIVRGFSKDSRNSYLLQYKQDFDCSEDLLSDLSDAERMLGHLTYIPLYVSLLCMLLEDQDEEIPDTKTKLIQEVIHLMEARTAAKLNLDVENVESKIEHLSKFAYDTLCDKTKTKTSGTFNKDIVNIGVLVQERSKSKLRPSTKTHFVHKIFQEFLAAKYLVSLVYSEMLTALNALDQDIRTNVTVFLTGLYGTNQRQQLFQLYKDIVCKSWSTMSAQKHIENHTGLQCLAETGRFDGFTDIAEQLFPKETHLDPDSCFPCLKGVSVACEDLQSITDLVLDPDDLHWDITQCEVMKKQCLKCKTIPSVVIRSATQSGHFMADCLIFYLPAFPSLRHLYVCCDTVSPYPADFERQEQDLSEACQRHEVKLHSLVFEGSRTRHFSGADNVQRHLDVILAGLTYSMQQNLQVLVLNDITFSFANNSKVLERLVKTRCLQAVAFVGVSFDISIFQQMALSLLDARNLKHFQVEQCFEYELNPKESEAIPETNHYILSPPYFSHTSFALPDEVFHIIANNRLENLVLKNQKADWSLLAPSLKGSIHSLISIDLSFTNLDSTALFGMTEYLQCQNLHTLVLRGLSVEYDLLAETLREAKFIRNLDLSCNKIGGETIFPLLCESLMGKSELENLSLAACGITDETVCCLWSVLENGTIRSLNLEANLIVTTDEACVQFVALLSCAAALVCLYLPMASFTEDRLERFFSMIQGLQHLTDVSVTTQPLPEVFAYMRSYHQDGTERPTEKMKRLNPNLKNTSFGFNANFLQLKKTSQNIGNCWRDLCLKYSSSPDP